MGDHRYPKRCYYMLKSFDAVGRVTWATHIKNLLFLYGFGYVWIAHDVGDTVSFINIFRQRLIDCFTQDWHATVNDSSRCYHYKHFKTLLNTERYLSIDLPVKIRRSLARFRASSHQFHIETGRYVHTPLQERICQFCFVSNNISTIECEFHVFFHCSKFINIRNKYLFNWYSAGRNLENFYSLLNSTENTKIQKIALFIDKLLNAAEIS